MSKGQQWGVRQAGKGFRKGGRQASMEAMGSIQGSIKQHKGLQDSVNYNPFVHILQLLHRVSSCLLQ